VRKADCLGQSIVEDRRAQSAGLGHKGNGARLGRPGRKGHVHGHKRVNDAQAVRADDANAVFPGDSQELLFPRGTLWPCLTKARCDDHRALDALLPAFAHDAHHGTGRDHDHSQVYRAGRIQDGLEHFEPKDLFSSRVDGIDGPGEPAAHQIGQHLVPKFGGICRRANDSDRLGIKKHVQHGSAPLDLCATALGAIILHCHGCGKSLGFQSCPRRGMLPPTASDSCSETVICA